MEQTGEDLPEGEPVEILAGVRKEEISVRGNFLEFAHLPEQGVPRDSVKYEPHPR